MTVLSVQDSEYEQILEKLADQYVENNFDEHAPGAEFFPPGIQKKRAKDAFKQDIRLEELGNHLKEAVSLLFTEGKEHLEEQEWQSLQSNLISAKKAFLELSLGDEMPKILYPRLGLNARNVSAIDAIARKLYLRKDYAKAVSLNVLLTLLNGLDSNYWNNLGICFQEAENYEKAILAYEFSKELNPKNVGAFLFSAECYLRLNNLEKAKEQLNQAEELISQLAVKDQWIELVSSLKLAIEGG